MHQNIVFDQSLNIDLPRPGNIKISKVCANYKVKPVVWPKMSQAYAKY